MSSTDLGHADEVVLVDSRLGNRLLRSRDFDLGDTFLFTRDVSRRSACGGCPLDAPTGRTQEPPDGIERPRSEVARLKTCRFFSPLELPHLTGKTERSPESHGNANGATSVN